MRNLRETPNVSDRKSNDQRSPGRSATGMGVRDPSPFPAPLSLHTQFLVRVEAIQLLGVDSHLFAFQHQADPLITKPTVLGCDRFHFPTYLLIVRRLVTPDNFGINTNKTANFVLRDIVISQHTKCYLSSRVWRC